jgi:hypothetical protein
MKKLISNYTFNPTAKKVTFSDYTSISLERVLLITNVTINEIIYSFADPAKGGSVSGNVLTLDYDTTGMSSTDKLQIWYEDIELPAIEEGNINSLLELFKMLIQSPLGRLAIDGSNRLRVFIDGGTSAANVGVTQSGNWSIPTYSNGSTVFQLSNIEYNECQRSKFTFT